MPGNVYWTDTKASTKGCNLNVAKTLRLTSTEDIIGKTIHELIANKTIADEISKIDAEVIKTDNP